MGHNCVRIKVRRRKVAALAAYSRQFTVKNCTTGAKLKTVKIGKDTELKVIEQNGVMYYRAGWKGIFKNLHIAGNLYTVSEKPDYLGMHCHLVEPVSWSKKKYPQPKSYWLKTIDTAPTRIKSTSLHKDPVKMNRVQYMEKLTEHKLAKWERKNPCPVYSPDLFYSQEEFNKDVEKWKQERENMKERFRDFVVSIYDKLLLTGRFVLAKKNSASYMEEKVAELKDINGEGHRVNELPKDSPLIKKAQKKTNEIKAKRPNLVATNLKDHKKQKGRIILPQAA